MKRLVLALVAVALVAVALAMLSACGDKLPSDAVAQVGDTVIPMADFTEIMDQQKNAATQPGSMPFPSPGTYQYNVIAGNIVDYLVQTELVKQEAAARKITVADADIEKQIQDIYKQYGGEDKVKKMLSDQGLDLAYLHDYLYKTLLMQKVYAAITAEAKPTEAELKAYFEQNKARFNQPATRESRHILVKTKAQADEVRALLAADPSDANWKKVAKKYSDDPASKDKGGASGPHPAGQMPGPYDKVLFSIKLDTLSAPIKTKYGWYVLEATKATPAKTATFEEVKAQLEQMLGQQATQTAWDDWLKKAKADTKIIYAAGFDPAKLTVPPSPAATTALPQPQPTKSK
jgi:parvulin-like peptidyl-prolyl isomerase